jgi:hypothetical protein
MAILKLRPIEEGGGAVWHAACRIPPLPLPAHTTHLRGAGPIPPFLAQLPTTSLFVLLLAPLSVYSTQAFDFYVAQHAALTKKMHAHTALFLFSLPDLYEPDPAAQLIYVHAL